MIEPAFLLAVGFFFSPPTQHNRLCYEAVNNLPVKDKEQSFVVCVEVAEAAEKRNLPPILVVAQAHQETKLRDDLVGKSGEVGPLQAMPNYWCPKEEQCNHIGAGLDALEYYIGRKGKDNWNSILCHYNAGNTCLSKSRKYAKNILYKRKKLKQLIGR
jgi:hypothetical protein